jgi:hypothetical protein
LNEEAASKEAFQKYLRAEPQGQYAEDSKNRLTGGGGG